MNKLITTFFLASSLSLPLAAVAAPADTQAAAQAKQNCHEDGHGQHKGGKRGHRDGEGRGLHGRDGLPFHLRGITLTDAQKSQIDALQKEDEQARKAKWEAARKARGELFALAEADKFDEKRAQRLSQEIASAQADLELSRVRQHARVLQLLTPEQRQQLKQREQERAARFEAKKEARAEQR